MLRQEFLLMILGVLMFSGTCFGANSSGEAQTNIYYKLYELEPLPKIHYSFPIPREILGNRNDRRLYELARITHALSISGEWATEQQVENSVYICARVNKTKPVIKCSLAVNFSPWHRKFDKNLPPTDRGKSYKAELEYFSKRLTLVRKWCEESNKKYQSNVEITAVLLDCERFYIKAGDKTWNKGMQEALDAVHITAKVIFPKARIEWYGRGMGHVSRGNGWEKTHYFTGREIIPSLSCSLYYMPELEKTQELYRRTAELADRMGVEEVNPWIALASGYRRGIIKSFYWDTDWDYDLIYSFLIGARLNIAWYGNNPGRFAPYNRAKIIIFYPPPFDPRTPAWGKHFIAYVRGATGIKDLSDLGHEQ